MNSYGKGAFVATQPKESVMEQFGDQTTKNSMLTCVRCKRPLLPKEDVYEVIREFHGIVSQSDNKAVKRLTYGNTLEEQLMFQGHYHFLPVYDGEKEVCTGSTSRMQYLEGHPRETTGAPYFELTFYDEHAERPTREAYKRVQEKFATRV